jgi:hypothetical protein
LFIKIFDVSGTLLIFSFLSSFEKFRSLFNPVLKVSPSNVTVLIFFKNKDSSNELQSVDFPEPDNPKNHITIDE